MLDLSKHPSLKYILFGNIYFANGIQGALVFMLLIVYFTVKDISIATTTLVAGLASIHFTFKFVFGPLTDHYMKKGRRPFVVIGGFLGGIALLPLAFIDPSQYLLLFTMVLLISVIGIVLLDVCADAWAIQETTVEEHGKVNAAMFSSLFAGMAVGSVLLTQIAHKFSYNLAFIVTGIIILATLLLPLVRAGKNQCSQATEDKAAAPTRV